jgi:hypothetical protein
MNTLYISDLDGTLLNGDTEVSRYSAGRLNSMMAGGAEFSIATARTAATAKHILSGLDLALPVVLMNGAGMSVSWGSGTI